MAEFLSAEVIGDRNVLRNLDKMPEVVRAILVEKTVSNVEALKKAVEGEIGGFTKSGKLLSAVRSEMIETPGKVEGRVYIDESVAPYARAQDQGADIPAHIIRPKDAKVLAFMGATGDKVFATRVFHPGATLAPKNFMANARRGLASKFSKDVKNAVVQGLRANMREG